MERIYDLAVIGGGPGGYTAAEHAARLGLDTVLVEARELGGTCLNRGCIPTKAMLHAVETLRAVRQSGNLGIHAEGIAFDYGEMIAYRRMTVTKLTQGVGNMLRAAGVTVVNGRAQLDSPDQVRVTDTEGNGTTLKAGNILLAAGSKPRLLPVPGMELPGVLDSDALFALEKLPESLVIIGGGVIGVEMAEAFFAMGTKVTLIEARARLLPEMDREISQNLRMIFRKRGIEMHVGAALQRIVQAGRGLRCIFSENGKAMEAEAQYVLCAVGRCPDTEGLFVSGMELQMTAAGHVAVDEHFQTSIRGVYAVGDLVQGPQLAHAASAQGKAVAEILAGRTPSADLSVMPRCVYTSPEIAEVGLTEKEAAERGIPVKTGKALMGANGRTVIRQSERGFMKVVADAKIGEILGAQLMCERATDIIGEFAVAVANHLTVEQMVKVVRPHPTFEEAAAEAMAALDWR